MSSEIYLCLPMPTYAYLCLPMPTYAYLYLPIPIPTYVCPCLMMLGVGANEIELMTTDGRSKARVPTALNQ